MAKYTRFFGSSACKILLNAVVIVAALFVTVAVPAGKGPVAVFAAPWSANAAEIVAQAGGQLVAAGRSPRIIMGISADEDFVSRLYRAGAILVTDPRYAIGCHTETTQEENQ
jgi:cytochrome bd-type quinol oxidase subunit 1